jgi:hypothetical protein
MHPGDQSTNDPAYDTPALQTSLFPLPESHPLPIREFPRLTSRATAWRTRAQQPCPMPNSWPSSPACPAWRLPSSKPQSS